MTALSRRLERSNKRVEWTGGQPHGFVYTPMAAGRSRASKVDVIAITTPIRESGNSDYRSASMIRKSFILIVAFLLVAVVARAQRNTGSDADLESP
jgi:hypothetical protein